MVSAPQSLSTGTEALIEAEAKRRCIEAGYTLEYLACQDRRFAHDNRDPWWRAMYYHAIKHEIERLEKSGFTVLPRSGDVAQPPNETYRETVRRVAAAREKGYAAARENLREAWAALAMIREAVETLAPSGSVKAAEHLDGPTFAHEAEALVAGIMAIASSVSSTPDGGAA